MLLLLLLLLLLLSGVRIYKNSEGSGFTGYYIPITKVFVRTMTMVVAGEVVVVVW